MRSSYGPCLCGDPECPRCFPQHSSEPSAYEMSSSTDLVAQLNMKEFDPSKERHLPLMLIKFIDPGCTAELQLENCRTGEVVRVTTTENVSLDKAQFRMLVLRMFDEVCKGVL